MKTYLSNDRLLYFLGETKTEMYFRHIIVYAYVITFSKVCFLLLLDNLFGWHISHYRCDSWQQPICQTCKIQNKKKRSGTFACCSSGCRQRDLQTALPRCGGGEWEIELGILAQEEKDTILKLGRRANARVWGAKRVRKGEAGVLGFHAEFVIPFQDSKSTSLFLKSTFCSVSG